MPRLPLLLTAATLAATGLVGTAHASQTFDFAAITCGEFLRATPPGRDAITLWLDGYFSSNPDESKVDVAIILQKVPALVAACEERRDSKIAGVFEMQEGLSATSRVASDE